MKKLPPIQQTITSRGAARDDEYRKPMDAIGVHSVRQYLPHGPYLSFFTTDEVLNVKVKHE